MTDLGFGKVDAAGSARHSMKGGSFQLLRCLCLFAAKKFPAGRRGANPMRTSVFPTHRLDREEFSGIVAARRVGNVAPTAMKKDLHPKYNPVVFVDMTTGARFITRSTKTSDKKEVIDGVEHSVISVGITADSHPFFTGQKQFVDTEGRIDKFTKRFGAVRRVGKPKLNA
jgi:large subunit ribosomal protein L31